MARATWLYEDGIGEARAALVADGRIVAAAIEPEGTLTVGTVAPGRVVERLAGGGGRVALDGGEVLVAALPAGCTQGARVTVEITREAIPERGRPKPPRGVVGGAAPASAPGATLLARIGATRWPVRRLLAHEPDLLEQAGWSELLDEAAHGDIPFPGGRLRMHVTPAMTLLDVDGHLAAEPLALALAAAAAAADAIVRHGLGGSVGIDFPTLSGKASRQAVAAALDDRLARLDAGAFERTAVNGFGFLQVVRPRPRPSLPERLLADPTRAATAALLRQLERSPAGAPTAHAVVAAVARRLDAHPAWRTELARRTGVVHRLEAR